MANPDRGEVALMVGDKEYTLRPSIGALRELQQRMGGKPLGPMLENLQHFDVEVVTQLLFTYLQPYHAKEFQRVKQAEAIIEALRPGGEQIVIAKIGELLSVNMPRKTPPVSTNGSGENPPAAQAGISDGSGSTPDGSA